MRRRKPDENAPAVIFLCLVIALLFGLVLWKVGPEDVFGGVLKAYIIGLTLCAGFILLCWLLAKKREKRAAAVVAESGEVPAAPSPSLRQQLARCILWTVVSVGLLAYLCRDLMQGWYNNAVYRALFLLLALLATVNQYKQYKKARNAWKKGAEQP